MTIPGFLTAPATWTVSSCAPSSCSEAPLPSSFLLSAPAFGVPPASELRTTGSVVGFPDQDCQKNHTTSSKQGRASNIATRHGVRHRSRDGERASADRSSVPDLSPASVLAELAVIKACTGSRGSVLLSWAGCASASWSAGGARRTANRSRAALAASSAGEARFLRGICTSLGARARSSCTECPYVDRATARCLWRISGRR